MPDERRERSVVVLRRQVRAVLNHETSSTIFPLLSPPGVKTLPAGPVSISSGTATRLPSLLLTQRTNTGLGLLDSPSPSACWALRLVLGACFLSSLLMVSLCAHCQPRILDARSRCMHAYLDLLIPLLAQVAPTSRHLSSSHRQLLGSKVLLSLHL